MSVAEMSYILFHCILYHWEAFQWKYILWEENFKHLEFPALYLLSELFNKQSPGFIIIPNLLYFWPQYIYPVAKLTKETHYCQWSSVKMCEQDNQVIITLIVIKTFVSLILDCYKIHTIL